MPNENSSTAMDVLILPTFMIICASVLPIVAASSSHPLVTEVYLLVVNEFAVPATQSTYKGRAFSGVPTGCSQDAQVQHVRFPIEHARNTPRS
jgi:hypothetical protein